MLAFGPRERYCVAPGSAEYPGAHQCSNELVGCGNVRAGTFGRRIRAQLPNRMQGSPCGVRMVVRRLALVTLTRNV